MQNIRFKSGFTLVEALVALSILIVGIISGFILVTKALYDVTIIQDRLTASFLAQEGIELVRQIRDTNYLKKLNEGTGNWDDGLNNGDNIVIVNTNTGSVTLLSSSNPSYDPYLYYHPLTGLYDHDSSGSKTSFQRVINIYHIPPNDPNANEIRVQSIMDWKSKNINFEFTAEDHLFNWLSI